VLELGPDRTLVVAIEAGDAASFDELVPIAMPIVRSFAFRH
jgi:hypothetical protein